MFSLATPLVKRIFGVITICCAIGASTALAAPTPEMSEGMRLVDQAASATTSGDLARAKSLLDAAVVLAPRLGLAHVELARFFVQAQDFASADSEYRKALGLLEAADQPVAVLATFGPVAVSASQLAGDALVQHAFCLVKLAEAASRRGDSAAEQAFLRDARSELMKSKSKQTSIEHRQMAEQLLSFFK